MENTEQKAIDELIAGITLKKLMKLTKVDDPTEIPLKILIVIFILIVIDFLKIHLKSQR